MARLDVEALRLMKEQKKREIAEYKEALSLYHHYYELEQILQRRPEHKPDVAEVDPSTAVYLIRQFADREIGELVVIMYSENQDRGLRELAHLAEAILDRQSEHDQRLDYILNARPTLDLHPDYDVERREAREAFRESAVAAFEERRAY